MSTASVPRHDLSDRLRDLGAGALVAGVGLTTMFIAVGTGGDPILTLAPVLTVSAAFLLTKVPLRGPATALVFLLLALEVTGDGVGVYNTPLVVLGDLLSDISGARTGVKIASMEVLVPFLVGLGLYRSAGVRAEEDVPAPVPSLVWVGLVLYFLGFVYAEALSLSSGYGLVPWKARYILHVPLFFALFHLAYRSAPDYRLIGVAVVLAAHVKALIAIWIQKVAAPALTGGPLLYATSHGDSILFAMSLVMVLVPALEGTSRRAFLRAALLTPIPLWGIIENRRRIAWAMLEVSLLAIFLLSRWRPWKRNIARVLVVGAPVVALYLGLGWNSNGGGVFGPVYKIRTMLDSSIDPSTYWREVEAWNIATTLRDRTIFGIGLGGEYTETMLNDDISAGYKDYRAWPHNTFLGLMLYAGLFGFIALWLPTLITVFLAVRSYRFATSPADRAAALTCVAAVVCCCVLAWGDTGAHYTSYKLAAALSLAVAGRLATTTGAWPHLPSSAPRPVP